ncbi:RCC1 domain-containing protein [Paenibacillus chartarius]|uniref:RCC1 domain-containing protein n=1 Tax=Paenibacillus chartarius TaxID=747481 RepID=A0ABV6DLE5_9BACL
MKKGTIGLGIFALLASLLLPTNGASAAEISVGIAKLPTSAGTTAGVVTTNGNAYLWGGNDYQQIPGQTDMRVTSPKKVFDARVENDIRDLTLGNVHIALVKGSDGTVWTSGGNNNKQLGIGDSAPAPGLNQVPGLSGVEAVAAGREHTLALTAAGSVFAWGFNYYGQTGADPDVTGDVTSSVYEVSGFDGAVDKIAAGGDASLALTVSGAVYAWGDNRYGVLGSNDTTMKNPVPREIPFELAEGEYIVDIAAGEQRAAALTSSGRVYQWGVRLDGTDNNFAEPVLVSGFPGPVQQISCGFSHCLALINDGTVYGWGKGEGSMTLRDASTYQPNAIPVDLGLSTVPVVSNISARNVNSVVVTDDELYTWGRGVEGQYGNGESGISGIALKKAKFLEEYPPGDYRNYIEQILVKVNGVPISPKEPNEPFAYEVANTVNAVDIELDMIGYRYSYEIVDSNDRSFYYHIPLFAGMNEFQIVVKDNYAGYAEVATIPLAITRGAAPDNTAGPKPMYASTAQYFDYREGESRIQEVTIYFDQPLDPEFLTYAYGDSIKYDGGSNPEEVFLSEDRRTLILQTYAYYVEDTLNAPTTVTIAEGAVVNMYGQGISGLDGTAIPIIQEAELELVLDGIAASQPEADPDHITVGKMLAYLNENPNPFGSSIDTARGVFTLLLQYLSTRYIEHLPPLPPPV